MAFCWELNKQVLSSRLCFWFHQWDQKSKEHINQHHLAKENSSPKHQTTPCPKVISDISTFWRSISISLMIHSSWAWALSISDQARMMEGWKPNHDDFQVKCQFLVRLLFHVFIFRFSKMFQNLRSGNTRGRTSQQPTFWKKKRKSPDSPQKTPWP